jgi:capsular polysaccharide biosynthesis protein
MIRKLAEAFFRHKLLILLPPLIIPAIVIPVAVLTMPPLYDTAVSIWVEHPTYLNSKDGASPWLTPVQSQTGRLSELMRTRAFLVDVAQRTSLAPLVGSPASEARLADLVSRSATIGGVAGNDRSGASEHLLVIRVQAQTAQISYELCKAIVDAFQEKSAADQADQASVAVQFFQSRVQEAQQTLNKSSQDLRRYVVSRQADGNDTASDPTQLNLTAAMLDPRLAALQSGVQAAQADFNNSQAALTQAQRDAMAAAQGQQFSFQVLDAPQMPPAPTPQTKKIMIYPIAAAVAGLGLSAMLLVVLVASDRSVHSESDLAPGLRVLGTVPLLKLKRVPKNLRSVAARRAVGAVAGAALPAPGGAR